MAVRLYHNILWSKYKGEVFSSLHALACAQGATFTFVQIARSEGGRAALAAVDLRHHRYPFMLMFECNYEAVATWRLIVSLVRDVLWDGARLVVLPGYHRPEYWAMLVACMVRGKRRAVFCDSTAFDRPTSRVKAVLKRFFFSRCDVFFAYGQRSAQYLVGLGAKSEAVFAGCQAAALPMGFDAASAFNRRVAARAGAPGPLFLYVGRLAPEKDLITLLEAFAAFHRREPEARLVLVGEGVERNRLLSAAGAFGIAGALELTGGLDADALSLHYCRALCLVLPSTSEPWGLVVNEALHHGCPAVVSEVCGCRPDLIVDGVTGFAFGVGDVASLLARMDDAARCFADPATTARACQTHIAGFTPAMAARRMFEGCSSALGHVSSMEAR